MGRKGLGVRAKSASSIEISFTYCGVRCYERIQLEPTAVNLARAERHRQAILLAIEHDTFDYAVTFPNSRNLARFAAKPPLTVGVYLQQWLNGKQPQLKASTYAGYKKIIKVLAAAHFGNLQLADIKRKHVAEWASRQTCGNKRLSNLISPLRAALTDAQHNELIEINPLANWTYKKLMPPKTAAIEPFSREEQALLLAHLSGQGRNLFQFAFWTGLRTSELIAVEWGDVDWNRGIIRIERALTQDARADEITKTKAGERDVKLLPPALDALKAQKAFTFLQDKRIFHNPRTGKPWLGDQAIRRTLWIPALKRAGLRYRNPYVTRHTYASMMLSAGENIAWISKQLGHSNSMMTMRVYAKFIPDSIPDAGDKTVNLFWREEKK
jgi:integrase